MREFKDAQHSEVRAWSDHSDPCRKSSELEILWRWVRRIRNTRGGTIIELDVNSGVYTMDMRICLDEPGLVFSWAGTLSSQTALDKIVRLAALCRGEEAEISQFEERHCM